MANAPDRRFMLVGLGVSLVLMLVFAGLVVGHGRRLRTEIRQKMIAREADVLSPVAQQQVEAAHALAGGAPDSESLLGALLPDTRREGLLALAIFDADGVPLEHVPASQPLVDLPIEDFSQLQNGRPIARFSPAFSLSTLHPGAPLTESAPVLELILPLRAPGRTLTAGDRRTPGLIGYVRYHLDGRSLAQELDALDRSARRVTSTTLAFGLCSLALILGGGGWALARAQRTIAERNHRLVRANLELALAAKTSALGQITSHLLHGIQGPIAGLRAVIDGSHPPASADADWKVVAGYTGRVQAIVQETVALLNEDATHTAYELTGHDLLAIIVRRNAAAAEKRQVALHAAGGFEGELDSHRGGLLCLIASNLLQNAIEATAPGHAVTVDFRLHGSIATLTVSDEGHGIPGELKAHLFEPGRTGRAGGTGLGLAISQLLARQIGASLELVSTGPAGTVFALELLLA